MTVPLPVLPADRPAPRSEPRPIVPVPRHIPPCQGEEIARAALRDRADCADRSPEEISPNPNIVFDREARDE